MEADTCTHLITPTRRKNHTRRYLKAMCILALIAVIAFWMDHWFRGEMGIAKKFADLVANRWGTWSLIVGGLLYIVLLSLPFVPGVELGLLLMCVFGEEGIAFVYIATVMALNLSFGMGRLLPQRWVMTRLEKIRSVHDGQDQAHHVVGTLESITTNQNTCQKGFFAYLSRHRYLAIGILYNIPGNYLIGGGGGISLACGFSTAISWRWFFLTVVIAVAPVPLLVWFGVIQLESFLGIK